MYSVRKRTSLASPWKASLWGGLVRSVGTAPHQIRRAILFVSFGMPALGQQTVTAHKVGADTEVPRSGPLVPRPAGDIVAGAHRHKPPVLELEKPGGCPSLYQQQEGQNRGP